MLYLTFKPRKSNTSLKEFQDAHPEINLGTYKESMKLQEFLEEIIERKKGLTLDLCKSLENYVDFEASSLPINIFLKDLKNEIPYKNQSIRLFLSQEQIMDVETVRKIKSNELDKINTLSPEEFWKRVQIYHSALRKIPNRQNIDSSRTFYRVVCNPNIDIDEAMIQKHLENPTSIIKPNSKKIEEEQVEFYSYFDDCTPEEIQFLKQFNSDRREGKLYIDFKDVPDELLPQVIQTLEGKEKIALALQHTDKERILKTPLKSIKVLYISPTVINAQEDITKRFRDAEVAIGDSVGSITVTDLSQYKILLKRLRKIVDGIPLWLPESVRFKKVYTRLGKKLTYDTDMLSKSDDLKEYREQNKEASRNLINALLKNKCLCAGMAETLTQALSLVNIASINCLSNPIESDEEEKTHMYNLVKINGNWYNTDLTWDAKNIKKGNYPRFCLKSNEEFENISKNKEWHQRSTNTDIKCPKSKELFRKEKIKNKIKEILKSKTKLLSGNKHKQLLLPKPRSEFGKRIKVDRADLKNAKVQVDKPQEIDKEKEDR